MSLITYRGRGICPSEQAYILNRGSHSSPYLIKRTNTPGNALSVQLGTMQREIITGDQIATQPQLGSAGLESEKDGERNGETGLTKFSSLIQGTVPEYGWLVRK